MKRRSLLLGLLALPVATPVVAVSADRVLTSLAATKEFADAMKTARGQTPCIQHIDELPFVRPHQQDGLQHVLASKHYVYDNDIASLYWHSVQPITPKVHA